MLKILVLSNLYPPHYIGGYELGCRDVVEALRGRGHEVQVLTSAYGIEKPAIEGHVLRLLDADYRTKPLNSYQALMKTVRKEIRNQRVFDAVYRKFAPDIVYGWNMGNISLTPAQQASGCPVCYMVSDDWLATWERDAWNLVAARCARVGLKKPLGAALKMLRLAEFLRPLDLAHVQFTSDYLRQAAIRAGKGVAHADVIHWGIMIHPAVERTGASATRLLYAGQVMPHKGVHTAIEAFAEVVRSPEGGGGARLTIAGGTTSPEYLDMLKSLVGALGVEDRVDFTGRLDREALFALYEACDILIFPSIWEEPFSITLLEALAAGMAVVSTDTGGTGEILVDEENALLFPKEDAARCAAQIRRLLHEPGLSTRLGKAGRRIVAERFSFTGMVDKVEAALQRIVTG